jgi:hypothetical protein
MKNKSDASRSYGGTLRTRFSLPRLIQAAVLSLIPLFAGGCAEGPRTYGNVILSHPEVFTRERLVIARERELQFLNKTLDEAVPTTIQGASDSRTLSAFENNLAMTFSPTPVSNAPNIASATLSDLSKLSLATPADAQLVKGLSISSIDHFDDVMAYRDTVNSVIREKELDDEHDRRGTTLYTLKFDCSLFPGVNTKAPALIEIHLADPVPPKDDEINALYHKWILLLNQRLAEDENALQVRVDRKQIGPNDLEMAFTYIEKAIAQFNAIVDSQTSLDLKQKENCKNKMAEAEAKTLSFFWLPPESRQTALSNFLLPQNYRDHLSFIVGLQACLYAKYQQQFSGLVSFKYSFKPFGTNIDINGELVPYEDKLDPIGQWAATETESDSGFTYFKRIIKEWNQSPYADSIDPKIYAQNISDVSSKVKLVDLAFAISAVLGKAGTLADNARSLNESQTLLQAIKRQPLAVSYASGDNFGWLMSPVFAIKNGKADFVQSPTKESFSASIVIPVWARSLMLTGKVSWLNDHGKPVKSSDLKFQPVNLPSDLDALTSAIQERKSAHLPKPTLYASQLSLQRGLNSDQTLLIFGRELWRNPQVFVGSIKANTVDLLPDMKGLLAHFPSFPVGFPTNADLTVVTSFGSASLDNAVTILSPEKTETAVASPPARLTSAFVVNGSVPLTFALNPGAMPAGFAGFSLKFNLPDKQTDWNKLDDSTVTLSSNGTVLTINIKLPDPQPTAPVKCTLDLGIRRTPYETPTSLLGDTKSNFNSLIYFPLKDQEKLRLTQPNPAAINYKTNGPDATDILLRPADTVKPTDIYAAYPGLQSSLKSESARLSLKATDKVTKTLTLKEDSAGWSAAVPAKSDDLPIANYDTITIEYQTSGKETTSLPVLGGPLGVKKQ